MAGQHVVNGGLQLELDAQVELQQLRAENRKLRNEHPGEAEVVDLQSDLERTKELYEGSLQALHEKEDEVTRMRSELDTLRERVVTQQREADEEAQRLREHATEAERERRQLEEEYRKMQTALETTRRESELVHYRAVDEEHAKGEEREARSVEQLKELRERRAFTEQIHATPVALFTARSPRGREGDSVSERGLQSEVLGASSEVSGVHSVTAGAVCETLGVHGGVPAGAVEPTAAPALVAQHLPPLSKFSEGQGDSEVETFDEWLEQLEMVAAACQWNEQAKLVNLTTRLKGQAYAFLRTCTPSQKASYPLLVERLRARFTPVNIPSVQTSLFHDRKQRTGESVDVYAQDLQQLFLKAYPRVQQGSREAEQLGKSMLASQFVAGLLGSIKVKLAGSDGDFDQLLTRARFEEARIRDFGEHVGKFSVKPKPSEAGSSQSNSTQQGRGHFCQTTSKSSGQCFSCGSTGHFQKQCPMHRRGLPRESRGPREKIATIVSHEDSPPQTVTEGEWQDSIVDKAIDEVSVTLHGVEPPAKLEPGISLGTIPTTEVCIEGVPATALVDTGSPTTIVSLLFLLDVLSKNRTPGQHLEQWREEVKGRLHHTSLNL